MKRIPTVTLLSVGALLACAVQLSAQQRYYRSDDRIVISKEPVFFRGTVTRIDVDGENTVITNRPVEPAPPFRLVDYTYITEANMTYYMATRDSAEIRMAQIALEKASDQRVRDVANRIIQERTDRSARVWHILKHDDVGMEPIADDPERKRLRELVKELDGMSSGSSFDAAYLRSVFFLHQNEIDVLSTNLKNAHDDDFEDVIEDSIENLTQTREDIRTVAQSLSVSLP
jgi:predicted outer membrane protein